MIFWKGWAKGIYNIQSNIASYHPNDRLFKQPERGTHLCIWWALAKTNKTEILEKAMFIENTLQLKWKRALGHWMGIIGFH
jgi:hypothetical protein